MQCAGLFAIIIRPNFLSHPYFTSTLHVNTLCNSNAHCESVNNEKHGEMANTYFASIDNKTQLIPWHCKIKNPIDSFSFQVHENKNAWNNLTGLLYGLVQTNLIRVSLA